jgi:hypothetical protein
MSQRALISVAYAAGFAMAPSEEDMAEPAHLQPDEALRNGHVLAARRALPPPARFEHLSALVDPTRMLGLRETLAGWLGGRAAA